MKLVGPASFSLTDSDFQILKNHLVGHLSLPIGLRMFDRSELVVNMILHTELFKFEVVELSIIISDDYSRQTELTDDRFL